MAQQALLFLPRFDGGRRGEGPVLGEQSRARWRQLWSNRERMDSPRFRRAGLPAASGWAASLGEFNGRVKGRDKYWTQSAAAKAILQVRTAVLSEDGRLTHYFAHRPGRLYLQCQPVP